MTFGRSFTLGTAGEATDRRFSLGCANYAPRAQGRRTDLDVLDGALFLPAIALACALGMSLRLVGPLFLVAPVGLCFAYALLRFSPPPKCLAAYVAFSLSIAALSLLRLMPPSWQHYFVPEAVFRQLVPLVGFFAVSWASKAYFERRLRAGDLFRCAAVMLILALGVAPVVMISQGLSYEGQSPLYSVLTQYGAFNNNVFIADFFLLGWAFIYGGWRKYAAMVFFVAVLVTTHFAQYRAGAALVVFILVGVPPRRVALMTIAAMVLIYAVALDYVPEIMLRSPNSGIRLAFLSDALASIYDTLGLGIGYGTESVRWKYNFPGMPTFTFLPNPQNITPERLLEVLSTGVENSFAQALLRTGAVGAVLLAASFVAAFPSTRIAQPWAKFGVALFGLLTIACFVNSALETPLSVVGNGFVYGFLIAMNLQARRLGGRPPRAASRLNYIGGRRPMVQIQEIPSLS